jgi:hypothetical protein
MLFVLLIENYSVWSINSRKYVVTQTHWNAITFLSFYKFEIAMAIGNNMKSYVNMLNICASSTVIDISSITSVILFFFSQ